MKCFSLFSGIGGFDLALQNKGHEMVGACEIDKYARLIYRKHFPNVPLWEDATKIKPEELPDFDLLCAGFPCQAFSLAGMRLGFEDTRGTLFYEIARIAREKRPIYLFLENVKGLLYHDEGRTFTTIIQVFYELGYDIEWQVINSKYFTSQNRERIYIMGYLREKPTQQIFPFGEIQTISNKKTQAETRGYGIWEGYNLSRDTIATLLAGERSFVSYDQNLEKVRMLTPLECERLQGFPDGWTEGVSNIQRYKQLGNAVTVLVIEFILGELKD